jgi:hypothetical protein
LCLCLGYVRSSVAGLLQIYEQEYSHIYLFDDFLQESFDIPRGRGHGGGDVELGEYERNSGELSLDTFFKKVFGLYIFDETKHYK